VGAPAQQTTQDVAPASRHIDLHLTIGTVLNLQNLSDKNGTRLQVRVLGYLDGRSILAAMPGGALLPVDLRAGDEMAVRYLMGRSVCGFRSRVLRVCTLPFPYFHLDYPTEVQRMDVRRSERVQVALAGKCEIAGGHSVPVEIRDLSSTGAMLSASEKLGAVSDNVRVSFELTFGEITRQLSVTTSIRNAVPTERNDGGGHVFRYGIQFQDLSEADRIFVRGFVFEQLVSRGSVTTLFAAAG
jgi:c-di-GMP-binding flagellar brake protein YcgR